MADNRNAYELLAERLLVQGFDVERVKNALKSQRIETPSWGYGNSGTRFKVFPWPGAARDVYEKLADAACVFRFTGVTPSVALHIPWDKVHDWEALKQYAAAACARNVAYMIDQSHNVEGKIEAMIVSVINCQRAYAKALLVDRDALVERQRAGDVLGAHRVLVEAYETDVRPLLAQVRLEMDLDPDPLAALKASGYVEKIAQARGLARGDGSGYPGV